MDPRLQTEEQSAFTNEARVGWELGSRTMLNPAVEKKSRPLKQRYCSVATRGLEGGKLLKERMGK